MGLWLKCPGCQAQNPLPLRSCPHCGQDLNNLSAPQRVYVMGPAAAPPPAAVLAKSEPAAAAAKPAITPSPEAGAATKPAKKPKRTAKKKK
jgi:hypothetical protein